MRLEHGGGEGLGSRPLHPATANKAHAHPVCNSVELAAGDLQLVRARGKRLATHGEGTSGFPPRRR